MREWWGSPWGFESPLRHHANKPEEPGVFSGLLFVFYTVHSTIRDSNRRGRRRAGGKARLQERVSPKPRRKGRWREPPRLIAGESPLRHQSKFAGAQRTWAPFPFRLVLLGGSSPGGLAFSPDPLYISKLPLGGKFMQPVIAENTARSTRA